MSQAQYNLHTKTDYLNRKMFLDPPGPVTIQRFEEDILTIKSKSKSKSITKNTNENINYTNAHNINL